MEINSNGCFPGTGNILKANPGGTSAKQGDRDHFIFGDCIEGFQTTGFGNMSRCILACFLACFLIDKSIGIHHLIFTWSSRSLPTPLQTSTVRTMQTCQYSHEPNEKNTIQSKNLTKNRVEPENIKIPPPPGKGETSNQSHQFWGGSSRLEFRVFQP